MRPWPQHTVEALRRGWAEGATAGAIGKRIGKSRVAVYKKALALGLPMRPRGNPKTIETTGRALRVGGPKAIFKSPGPAAKRAIVSSLAAGPCDAARPSRASVGTSPAVKGIECPLGARKPAGGEARHAGQGGHP